MAIHMYVHVYEEKGDEAFDLKVSASLGDMN